MTIKNLISRLRRKPASKSTSRNWTTTLSPRDWADLPTYHPRREDDAL